MIDATLSHVKYVSNSFQFASYWIWDTIFAKPPSVSTFCDGMILERSKFKSDTVLWENKFSAPNFPKMDSLGKVSTL